ncbi:MAG: LuxR C-terminal-related transcriptional regulator, partial [Chloroflexota bacterium]
ALLNITVPHLKIVIMSRQALPFTIAKMRAEGRITEIQFDDLRFTNDEVRHYFETRLSMSLSDKQLNTLSQSTEGWGVGLAMLALRLQNTPDLDTLIMQFAGTERFVSDYLLSEIFDQQSDDVQQFLTQTSLLNRLHGELIDTVLQRDDSHEQLIKLEQMGLLVVPLDHERKWYRYHHLFLDFLRGRLVQSDSAWQQDAHARASAWFADKADDNLEAVSATLYHAHLASDNLLLSTLQQFGIWLLKHGHQRLILHYLAPFSIDRLDTFPQLLIYLLWTLLSVGDLDRLQYVIQHALRYIPPNMQGDVLAIQAELEPDRVKQRELREKALHLLSDTDHITHCLLNINLARSEFFADGKTKQAIDSMTQLATQLDRLNAIQLWVINLDCLITMYLRQGTLAEAKALCHRGIAVCEANEQHRLRCVFYAQLGTVLYAQNQLDEAKNVLVQGRKMSDAPSYLHAYVASTLTLARCLPADDATDILDALRERVKTSAYFQQRVDYATDFPLADQSWIAPHIDWQKVTFDPETERVSPASLYTHLVLARRMAHGEKTGLRRAVSLLHQLKNLCQKIQRKSDLIETLILLSLAYERLGKRDDAIFTLEDALRIAQQTGHIRLFLDEGRHVDILLERICQDKFGHTDILHLFDPTLSPAPVTLETPLTRRETEILVLLASGLSNAEISETLSISLNTTRWHLKNLFRKLQVDNRTKASTYARTLGLLT